MLISVLAESTSEDDPMVSSSGDELERDTTPVSETPKPVEEQPQQESKPEEEPAEEKPKQPYKPPGARGLPGMGMPMPGMGMPGMGGDGGNIFAEIKKRKEEKRLSNKKEVSQRKIIT